MGVWVLKGEGVSEQDLMAAMLYNFSKYVEWSGAKGDRKGPLVIGVAGKESLRAALEEYANAKGGQARALEVRRIGKVEEAGECHIVYVGSEPKRMVEMMAGAQRAGTLTVGEGEAFRRAGGMVTFRVVESKLRFAINLSAANQAGITISAKLLGLAMAVER